MVDHRCTSATVRIVLKACESTGVDTDRLLSLAEIDRETADHPDGEVSFSQMGAFWQNAVRLSGDPFLGMHTAKYMEVGDYKCLDYLTIHAATIGDSLRNICRYTALINTWINWEVKERNDDVAVRMTSSAGMISPNAYEFVFSIITKRLRQVTTENWAPKLIRFPFPQPTDSQAHIDYFRTNLEYDAPVAEFVLTSERWKEPLSTSNQKLLNVLDEHARMLLARRAAPGDFIKQVRKEIVRELHLGEASRNNIARKMNMSPRTLQRRLEEHGFAYAKLVDEVREEFARTKLQASELSIAEISFLLGFSEHSSFNRAFKRWTGKTPGEYRREASQKM